MTNAIETARLLCGFLIIFCGVYMLNYPSSSSSPYEFELLSGGHQSDSSVTRFTVRSLRASEEEARLERRSEEGEGFRRQSLT